MEEWKDRARNGDKAAESLDFEFELPSEGRETVAGGDLLSREDVIELEDIVEQTDAPDSRERPAFLEDRDVIDSHDTHSARVQEIGAQLEDIFENEPGEEDAGEGFLELLDRDLEPPPVPVETLSTPVGALSEAGLEAQITPVVERVVERVTRDTVARVTREVIQETIDALKQSLEPPAEN